MIKFWWSGVAAFDGYSITSYRSCFVRLGDLLPAQRVFTPWRWWIVMWRETFRDLHTTRDQKMLRDLLFFVFWDHSTWESSLLHEASDRNVCIHESDGMVVTVVIGDGLGVVTWKRGLRRGCSQLAKKKYIPCMSLFIKSIGKKQFVYFQLYFKHYDFCEYLKLRSISWKFLFCQ